MDPYLARAGERATGRVPATSGSSTAVGISPPPRVSTNAGVTTGASVWEQLYRAHYLDVVRQLRRKTRDPFQAEDLAQDVFMAVGEALMAGRVSDPVAYLWVAAANRARNWVRDRRDVSLEALDPSVADPRADSAELDMCAMTRKDALLEGLRQLSPAQRDAYSLVDFRGFTEGEAAEVLGNSRSTVSKHRSRALTKLKREYLLADSC